MPNTDRMREEFEAWYENDPDPDFPWNAWQAACRARAKRDAEICQSRLDLELSTEKSEEALRCAQEIKKEAGL